MDLRARIIRSDEGAVPISAYTITCVNGPSAKGDVLTYCIAFQEHRHFPPASTEVTIYLCHANQAYQTHEGRPELRIHITPVGAMGLKPRVDGETVFVPSAACDLVYVNHGNKAYLREVYFVVEDCDTSLAADYVGGKIDVTHVPGARPQWRLGTDTSGILHRLFPKNWVPLEPVDPSQPSTVVPVELRPQRHPAWFKFRSTLDGQPLPGLSGKLSGTKWYKMLGKYPGKGFDETPGGFAGNPLTRAGRIMETPVTALYLDYLVKNRPHVQIKECGSFPHPTLVDVMASPDGLIVDPKKTLPGWFQTELRVEYMNDPAALAKIDFTRGVYECKTMATKDKKGDGPLFKEEHMAQLYAEMICTGTFWAEIVRFCHETKEMFVYRVYRKPTIARMFESVIVRMRRDLTEGGKTFAEAANHQDNHTLLHECAKHAVYYNEPRTKDSRRTAIPYDEKVFATVMAAMERSSGTLSPNDPNGSIVIPVADPATVAQKKKTTRRGGAVGVHVSVATGTATKARTRATGRTQKKAPTAVAAATRGRKRTKKEDDDPSTGEKRPRQFESEHDLIAAWDQIQSTNTQIARAIANGDWAPIQENNVFSVQEARYKMFSVALASVDLSPPSAQDVDDNDDDDEPEAVQELE